MFKTLISRYVMTHITKLPSQSMFNSEGSRFINKYNTTIEVIVYLRVINDQVFWPYRGSQARPSEPKQTYFARPWLECFGRSFVNAQLFATKTAWCKIGLKMQNKKNQAISKKRNTTANSFEIRGWTCSILYGQFQALRFRMLKVLLVAMKQVSGNISVLEEHILHCDWESTVNDRHVKSSNVGNL